MTSVVSTDSRPRFLHHVYVSLPSAEPTPQRALCCLWRAVWGASLVALVVRRPHSCWESSSQNLLLALQASPVLSLEKRAPPISLAEHAQRSGWWLWHRVSMSQAQAPALLLSATAPGAKLLGLNCSENEDVMPSRSLYVSEQSHKPGTAHTAMLLLRIQRPHLPPAGEHAAHQRTLPQTWETYSLSFPSPNAQLPSWPSWYC